MTFMPAMTADAALVPCALDGMRQTSRSVLAPRLVVRPDGEEPGELALAARVRLHRDLGVARDGGQPRLELVDQLLVTRRRLERREGVDVGETGQPHRFHFRRGVQLHGARPERDHAAVEREVDVGQAAEVAQHGRLGVVLGEDGMHEDGSPAQQWHGQRVAPTSSGSEGRCAEGVEYRADVVVGRGLATRDTYVVHVHQAQLDCPLRRRPHDLLGPPRGLDDDRVEELPVDERITRGLQSVGQLHGPAVHPARNAPQSLGTVVHRVHGRDHREEDLCGADVRRRLLAADVLLAGLERQAVGVPALGVDGQTDEASRQVSLQAGAHGHVGGVRSPVPQRHAEALGRTHDHIGSPLPRRGEQRQGQQVGRHRHQRAPRVGVGGHRGEVTDGARAPRVLPDHPEVLAVGEALAQVGHHGLEAERAKPRL